MISSRILASVGPTAARLPLVLVALLTTASPAVAQGVFAPDPVGYRVLLRGAGQSRGETAAEATPAEATAFSLFESGDLDAALQKIQAHIKQFRDAGEVDRQAVATDFEGLILQRHGKVDQAVASHAAAARMLEGGTDLPRVLSRINATINLGTAHYFAADYEKAEEQLLEAVALAEQSRPVSSIRLARGRALNNLGLVYYEMARFPDADKRFHEAAGLAGPAPTTRDDRQLRAQVLNNQGRLLAAEGHTAGARARLDEARTLAESMRDPLLQAAILDSLAEVLLATEAQGPERQALLETALAHLDSALALESKEPNALRRAGILVNRGRTLAALGRRPEAGRLLEDAAKLAENIDTPAVMRKAYEARGAFLLGGATEGERDRGIGDLKEAVSIVERRLGRVTRGAEREFVRAVAHLYGTLIDALLRKGDIPAALGYLERSKTTALRRELLKRSPQLRDADDQRALDGAQGLLREEEALAEVIASLRRDGNEEAANRLQPRLAALHRQAQVAVAEIQQRYEQFSQYGSMSPDMLLGHQRDLAPGHLLVTYFAADDALWLFVVSNPVGMSWRRVPNVGRRELDNHVRRYRALTTQVRGDRNRWRIDSWAAPEWKELRDVTDWLYRALLAPIESELKAARHLVVAPTGLLFYLPFHALGPYDSASGTVRFVVEDVAVSYVTTANLRQITSEQRTARPRTVLALGNPPYRHERPALRQLDYAEKEVDAIRSIFGSRGMALSGDRATLANLKTHLSDGYHSGSSIPAPTGGDGGPQRFGILHLATHGVIDPASPADSWLAFEGRSRLRAREVSALNLSGIHLVTLSACETGIAEDRPGTELMSLGRFFSAAGVPSVVVSLWQVDDIATQELMVKFYRGLDAEHGALDKAQALRDAQRTLLANPAMRHPFYWAGLILIGDWR